MGGPDGEHVLKDGVRGSKHPVLVPKKSSRRISASPVKSSKDVIEEEKRMYIIGQRAGELGSGFHDAKFNEPTEKQL